LVIRADIDLAQEIVDGMVTERRDASMPYARRISAADAFDTGYPDYRAVVIPAGVPHRIWSSSSAAVRYLGIDLQAPAAYSKLALAE
jgi:hypothetical protein